MRSLLVGLIFACLPVLAQAQVAPTPRPAQPAPAKDPGFLARLHAEDAGSLPYRLLVPRDYRPDQPYPIVIWLHGSGQRGRDNNAQLSTYITQTFLAGATRSKYPCFVMVPQCPMDSGWTGSAINKPPDLAGPARMTLATLAELQKEFNIDSRRIYIGGFSAGAMGTWDLVIRYPDLFAAAFPIAGPPVGCEKLIPFAKDLPIWVFQGDRDALVSVQQARDVVAALKALGSPVKYTEYRGGSHECATAMTDPELLNWLFSCSRKTPASFTPAAIPADAWPVVKTLPPGTRDTWTGKVERTLHGVPRIVLDGVHYRLRPADDGPAQVKSILDKIGKGEITGQCQVTGAVQIDGYAWIIVSDIQAK